MGKIHSSEFALLLTISHPMNNHYSYYHYHHVQPLMITYVISV